MSETRVTVLKGLETEKWINEIIFLIFQLHIDVSIKTTNQEFYTSKYCCQQHITFQEAAIVHLGLSWLQQPAELSLSFFLLHSETILNVLGTEGKQNQSLRNHPWSPANIPCFTYFQLQLKVGTYFKTNQPLI